MSQNQNYQEQLASSVASIDDIKKELAMREAARRNLKDFTIYTKPDYEMKANLGGRRVHEEIIEHLEGVESGKIKRLMVFIMPRIGKMLADKTPILTPNGFVRHGDLKAGDTVFGLHGEEVKVLGVSERTATEYSITFSTAEEIDCHGNHEWIIVDNDLNLSRIEAKEIYKMYQDPNHVKLQVPAVDCDGDTVVIASIKKIIKGYDDLWGRCIEVEGGIYLAGESLIPTHNSELASIRFPLWYLGRHPNRRVVISSYSAELANQFGRTARTNFISPEYRNVFPTVELSDSKREGGNWEVVYKNESGILLPGGGLYTVGTGGSLTGKGFDCLTGDTLVSTIDGKKYLRDIKEGDLVCTIFTGEDGIAIRSYREVLATKKIKRKGVVAIYYADGLNNLRRIVCSPRHGIAIINPDCSIDYKRADEIRKDDNLLVVGNSTGFMHETSVVRIEYSFKEYDLYDIQVEETECFVANDVLVHNCGIIDDPVKDRLEAESPTYQKRLYEWYTSTFYTRRQNQNSSIILMMTRWNIMDLAGQLLDDEKTGGDSWTVLNIPAIVNRTEMTWEGKWDKGYFMKMRETLPPKDWAALYMQDPVASSSNIFKLEDLRYYLMSDFEKEGGLLQKEDLKCGIFVDPAFSSSNNSDDAVALLLGRHKLTGDYYLIDQYADTSAPSKTFLAILNMFDKAVAEGFIVSMISIEDVSLNVRQTKFINDFRAFLKQNSRNVIVNQYRPELKKADRIKFILEPKINLNAIYLRNDLVDKTVITKLEKQLMDFPIGRKDDVIDCLAQGVYVLDKKSVGFVDTMKQKVRMFHNKITGEMQMSNNEQKKRGKDMFGL